MLFAGRPYIASNASRRRSASGPIARDRGREQVLQGRVDADDAAADAVLAHLPLDPEPPGQGRLHLAFADRAGRRAGGVHDLAVQGEPATVGGAGPCCSTAWWTWICGSFSREVCCRNRAVVRPWVSAQRPVTERAPCRPVRVNAAVRST